MCDLIIPFTDAPVNMIQNLNSKAESQGGTLTGDVFSGAINVPIMGSYISGSYTIAGQQMNLTIDHKPFLISCSQIESFLAGNLK